MGVLNTSARLTDRSGGNFNAFNLAEKFISDLESTFQLQALIHNIYPKHVFTIIHFDII
jgi:hypothetical protein